MIGQDAFTRELLATLGLVCIFGLTMLFFSLAFLVHWLILLKQVTRYLGYGLAAGLALFGLQVLGYVADPPGWGLVAVIALWVGIVQLTMLAGFTMLGMHYCAVLGRPSFPLLLRRFGVEGMAGAASGRGAGQHAGPPPDGSLAQALQLPGELPAEPAPDAGVVKAPQGAWPWRGYALAVSAVTAGSILYTVILFLATSPRMSEIIRQAIIITGATAQAVTPQAVLLVLASAFGEEIIFRLGIQSFLAERLNWRKRRYWLAIALTSALWTLGHAGVLDPGWVKSAQIFPVGLALGWLAREHGVESCILAHGLFNLILLFLTPSLIR